MTTQDTDQIVLTPEQIASCHRDGCVWVLPGSHQHGLKPAEMIGDDTGHCELAFANGTIEFEGAISVPIKAGAVLHFHALTAHRSLGNHTDRPRRSFIVSYQDALTGRGNKDQHKILRPATSVRNA